jgi:2-dehydro-3-deoxy-D-arabinonate dehydratase
MQNIYLLISNGRLYFQEGETIYSLTETIPSLDWLLQSVSAKDLIQVLREQRSNPVKPDALQLQAPVGQQEVWAAGVTYQRSEEAREIESGKSNIYSKVYRANRPELFFKALGQYVVGTGEPVGIRFDAKWSVPEPELVVVLNSRLEVIGFSAGNDMCSRDIEGENPLYLPQAKIYDRSCAIGPRIWLQPEISNWPSLAIHLKIRRKDAIIFEGTTSMERIHRPLPDLVEFLGRCKSFPSGVFMLTGTGIVPPDDFSLQAGDQVAISIDQIGELSNTVQIIGQTS